jgi:DNA/RNA endonuclease YhcR with UshA esterase domain
MIGDVAWRTRVRVTGRVRSVRVQPRAGVPTLACTLVDDTGGIDVVFLGRRRVAGIHPGSILTVEGMAGCYHDRLAILNPAYEFLRPS